MPHDLSAKLFIDWFAKEKGEIGMRSRCKRTVIGIAFIFIVGDVMGHHFKGLPHYNYFENYPQIPEEEFIGQAGDYETSLVVYDFQGINRDKVEHPDNVRLFLVIFNLLDNRVYGGPLTLEILDRDEVVHTHRFEAAELENLYGMHKELSPEGKYALRMTLHDENDLQCVIPFRLSSQIVHWGRWIAGVLVVLLIIAGFGARVARVKEDRREELRKRKQG